MVGTDVEIIIFSIILTSLIIMDTVFMVVKYSHQSILSEVLVLVTANSLIITHQFQ